MSETSVERRLREMAADWRQAQFPDKAAADDAGREALELLREWVRGDYGFPDEDSRRFTEDARALLARCEGEK